MDNYKIERVYCLFIYLRSN